MKQAPVPDAELRRAKDHLKGSLMLSLENTASRMSHLARQEIYFDRHFGLDETLAGRRARHRRRRAARRARSVRERIAGGHGARVRRTAATMTWRRWRSAARFSRDRRHIDARTSIMIARYTHPEMGAHLERPAPLRDLARGRARGGRRDGRRRASCRRTRRASFARRRRSTSPASRRSSRSPSTTSSRSRPRSPSTSARRRAGCTSA